MRPAAPGRHERPGEGRSPACRAPSPSYSRQLRYPGYELTIPGRRGRAGRPGRGRAAQLVQHLRDVALDRGFGQVQPGRDLRVGQALTEAGRHLGLAAGERGGQVPGAVAGQAADRRRPRSAAARRRVTARCAPRRPPGPARSGPPAGWTRPGTRPRRPAARAAPTGRHRRWPAPRPRPAGRPASKPGTRSPIPRGTVVPGDLPGRTVVPRGRPRKIPPRGHLRVTPHRGAGSYRPL